MIVEKYPIWRGQDAEWDRIQRTIDRYVIVRGRQPNYIVLGVIPFYNFFGNPEERGVTEYELNGYRVIQGVGMHRSAVWVGELFDEHMLLANRE